MVRPSLLIRYRQTLPCLASPTNGPTTVPPQSKSSRRPRGTTSDNVGLAAAALLPPIPLYRRLLKSHHSLPVEMKSLGDAYVKDEFRRHKELDNPLQIVGFLTQWKVYLDNLESQTGIYRGKKLDVQQFEKVRGSGNVIQYIILHVLGSFRTSNCINYMNL